MVVEPRVVLTTPIDDDNTKIFDKQYADFLTSYSNSNAKTIESYFKQRENQQFLDDIDPEFENVLSCLKDWGNSYSLAHDIDGVVSFINYEEQEQEKICFDREFDQEPKRKLRSVSTKEIVLSNQSTSVEIENANGSKSNSGIKDGIFSGRNSISNLVENKNEEQEEEYREFDQEPNRKLRSASKKLNVVSIQSKRVEMKNGNGLKSNSGNKGGNFSGRNSVSEREFDQEPKRKLRSALKNLNVVSDQSTSVEIENGSGLKSNSGNKCGIISGRNSVSEREFDQEPKRKLRSASKKLNVVSIQSGNGLKSNSGNKGGNFSGRVLKGRSDCDLVGNFETNGNEPDVDYYRFIKNCKIVDDGSLVYEYKGCVIVYCKKDEEKVKHDGNDSEGSFSDVEIIDSATFYKKDNVNEDGEVEGDFRQQVIAILKRPYDQVEYDNLWGDISFSKPKLHHKELRKGRELSLVTDTVGKSYLDYSPDLKTLFNRTHSDKPKCLNLLRGFFFWLKNQVHDGSFKPWQDTECLSLNPGSC